MSLQALSQLPRSPLPAVRFPGSQHSLHETMTTMRLVHTLLLLLLCSSVSAQSDRFLFWDIGGSVGFDAESQVSFESYEMSGTIATPWAWKLGEKRHLRLDLEVGFGVLHGEGTTGGFARVAPLLDLSTDGFPVSLFVTTGPVLLTEDIYGDFDLGGYFHFASAIGLKWRLRDGWSVAYRIQHLSNAGIESPNPGLDLHLFRIARSF
jgi:hypothetical protein